MAKRRTKAQKKKARVSYKLPELNQESVGVATKKVKVKSNTDELAIMSYDTHLLKTDLMRTIILSAVILGLELGVYYLIEYR